MKKIYQRNEEYDAFGPWILAITDKSHLPKRFEGHVDMTIDYDYIVKIPVNKERRDLKPGMDMYDAVIALKDNTLYIYERQGKKIRSAVVDMKEVASITVHHALLMGRLHLQLAYEEFVIEYNTVSKDLIFDLVNRIRNLYIEDEKTIVVSQVSEGEIDEMDMYFSNEWNRLKEEEGNIKLIATQKITPLKYENENFAKRMVRRLTHSHLKSCIYSSNGKEIIQSKNGKDFKSFQESDYNTFFTFIPIGKIDDVKETSHPLTDEITQLQVMVRNKQFKFLFHSDNVHKDNFYRNITGIRVF